MIEDYKALIRKDYKNVNTKLIFPLLKWSSGVDMNILHCREVNRILFDISPEIAVIELGQGLKNSFVNKFPKPVKFNNEKFDLVESYLIKHYNYGEDDIKANRKVIELLIDNKEWIIDFCNSFGIDGKERKLLGVVEEKFDANKMKRVGKVSLMDF